MASTFTTNKSIEKPANGDYVNDWNVPVNADWDIIDKAFGGTTTLNATGQSSTPVNLTATQYQPLILNITGTTTSTGAISTTQAFYTGSTSQGTVFADNSWLYLKGPAILFQNGGGSTISYIDGSGNFTATSNVTAYSDANLKTDVTTISNALSLVNKMRGVNYTRIDSGKRGVGVIAQEMQEVVPEVVHDTHGTLSVAYGNIVGVLIEAIKELSDKVAALESK